MGYISSENQHKAFFICLKIAIGRMVKTPSTEKKNILILWWFVHRKIARRSKTAGYVREYRIMSVSLVILPTDNHDVNKQCFDLSGHIVAAN